MHHGLNERRKAILKPEKKRSFDGLKCELEKKVFYVCSVILQTPYFLVGFSGKKFMIIIYLQFFACSLFCLV